MKKFWSLMLALMLLTSLSACAPAATQAPAAPAATEAPAAPAAPAATQAPAAAEPTQAPAAAQPTEAAPAAPAAGNLPEIVVAIWSGPEHDNLVKTAAEYEKKTGNKVTIEEIARESYHDKLSTTFLGGGSDYDVAYVSGDWTPEWVKAQTLVPLDTFINDPKVVSPDFKADDLQPGMQYLTIDGKIYGLPSEGDTAWLFYRKDLLEAKGIKVPETWDEYLDAVQKLNNPPSTYGAVIGAKTDEAVWDYMHYMFGMGGSYVDDNFNPTLNNEAGVKALTMYSDLRNKLKVVPPDAVNYGYNEILTSLQEGKAAMGVEWMAATADLQDCTKSPKVCKDGKPLLEYTLVPGVKGADGKIQRGQGASQWGWIIPAGSKNQEAAYKFIEWLTSPEGGKLWALNGGIPSNVKALSDPDVVAKIPQFKLLAEAMPYRHLFPNTTVSADMTTILAQTINTVVATGSDPKAALDEANTKWADALKKAGYIK